MRTTRKLEDVFFFFFDRKCKQRWHSYIKYTHTHTHSNNKEHIHTELLLDWRARGVALCFRLSVFFFFVVVVAAKLRLAPRKPCMVSATCCLLIRLLHSRCFCLIFPSVFFTRLSLFFVFIFFYFRFFFNYFAHPAMLSSAVTKCVSSRQLRCLVKLLFSFSCFHNYCILPRLQSTRLLFFFSSSSALGFSLLLTN